MGTPQTLEILKEAVAARQEDSLPPPTKATVFLTQKEKRKLQEKQAKEERKRLRALNRSQQVPKGPRPTSLADLALDVARHALIGEFAFEDLAVLCHTRFPERFCLNGYPEVPDSRKAWCCLWGRNGLISTGKLRRTSSGKLRVVTEQEVTPCQHS